MSGVAWDLVADIGGTNARFAVLLDGSLESAFEFHHSVQEYPEFADVIACLKDEIAEVAGLVGSPARVCLAVACPADVEVIKFTNSHWTFTQTQLRDLFNCQQLLLINDFEAVAHGITELGDKDVLQIGGQPPRKDRPIGILGAGTGLGMAALVPTGSDYLILDSEGGHADFAPADEHEIDVFNYLRQIYGRVSLERLLSGKGLINIYLAICHIEGVDQVLTEPSQVVENGVTGGNAQALRALKIFCESFGATAGNLALTLGARGGIYIAGGVIPRFKDFFAQSGFREKFEDKGRFRDYLQPIPVYLVTRDNLGLLGAAKKLRRAD